MITGLYIDGIIVLVGRVSGGGYYVRIGFVLFTVMFCILQKYINKALAPTTIKQAFTINPSRVSDLSLSLSSILSLLFLLWYQSVKVQ